MTRLIFLAAIGIIGFKIYEAYVPRSSGSGGGAGQSATAAEVSPVRGVPVSERKNVLLFTGTTWCPACQVLERNIVGTSGWRDFVGKEVNFTVYDVPRDPQRTTQRQLAALQRYRVQSFPTMMIVDGEGRLLSQRVGVAGDLEAYKRWIRGS